MKLKAFFAKYKLDYNSPVILTFTFLSLGVLIANTILQGTVNSFMAAPTSISLINPIFWFNLFSHMLAHSGWEHYAGNMGFLLLIGPLLEEKHGSGKLLFMIFLTAAITALFNALLFSGTVVGASGIVFMFIILGSFANKTEGKIPLTFAILFLIWVGKELVNGLMNDNISQFAHIMGGFCASFFGFVLVRGKKTKRKRA